MIHRIKKQETTSTVASVPIKNKGSKPWGKTNWYQLTRPDNTIAAKDKFINKRDRRKVATANNSITNKDNEKLIIPATI
jgi:hypothetical protein